MTERHVIIIAKQETVLTSWLRDASTAALCIGLIGVGVLLGSSAMEWLGALLAFIVILIKATGKGKESTFDIEGAKKRLAEIEAELSPMTEHTTEELPSTPDDMRHTALTITGWREDECRHSPQVASNAFQALSRRINAWGDEFEVQAQEVIALRERVDELTKQKQEIALKALSDAGQAFDAHEAQLKAEARVEELEMICLEVENVAREALKGDQP